MALLPSVPEDINPVFRRALKMLGIVLRGSNDPIDGLYSQSDFGVESGAGIPSHALPGNMARGLYLRTNGSLAATLYLTVDAGSTWTAIAVP